jgi:putative methionine-R-sulfoxide reductase with GAF domain
MGMSGEEICRKLEEMSRTGAGLERVLSSAVRLIKQADPRFLWAGIYEVAPNNLLRLGPCAGTPPEQFSISAATDARGAGLDEERTLAFADVRRLPNYVTAFDDARSSLVVRIRKGARVFAQIDVSSPEPDAFDSEAVEKVERVAEFLAEVYSRNGRRRAA